jgi:hypothetical protein
VFPKYWIEFIRSNNLSGKAASLSDQIDQSGVGVELSFLTNAQAVDEATNFWPGIGVSPDGFVPVGECQIGSGDYYYININDGPDGALYRIYHDEVGEHGYQRDRAVALILKNYREVLPYVTA